MMLTNFTEQLHGILMLLVKSTISDEITKIDKDNEELIRIHCDQKSKEIIGLFKESTGVSKISLPLNETELQERLQAEVDRSMSSFASSQSEFQDSPSFPVCLQNLQNRLKEVCDQRHHDNLVAYTKEVEVPLRTSKKIIQLSADRYDTEFSVRQYMKQVCLLNLNEGKPKNWPQLLKETIIENFLDTDQEMSTILHSRRGLWQNIKGFIQWILWLLNLYGG